MATVTAGLSADGAPTVLAPGDASMGGGVPNVKGTRKRLSKEEKEERKRMRTPEEQKAINDRMDAMRVKALASRARKLVEKRAAASSTSPASTVSASTVVTPSPCGVHTPDTTEKTPAAVSRQLFSAPPATVPAKLEEGALRRSSRGMV